MTNGHARGAIIALLLALAGGTVAILIGVVVDELRDASRDRRALELRIDRLEQFLDSVYDPQEPPRPFRVP